MRLLDEPEERADARSALAQYVASERVDVDGRCSIEPDFSGSGGVGLQGQAGR